jgi:hypothetical protein
MPLGRERGEWSTEVVINVPERSVAAKEPYRSNRSHQGDAAILCGLVVNVTATDGRGVGNDTLDLFREVRGKRHRPG